MDDRKPKTFRILWGSVIAQLGMGAILAVMGIHAINVYTS